jgi:hypothetical protein
MHLNLGGNGQIRTTLPETLLVIPQRRCQQSITSRSTHYGAAKSDNK